jgi:hypothetical protein
MSVFIGEHESPAKTLMSAAGMVGNAMKEGAHNVAQKLGASEVAGHVTDAVGAAHHVMTTGTAPPPAVGANFYTRSGQHVQFHGR